MLKDSDLGYLVDLIESVGPEAATQVVVVLDLPHDLSSVSRARDFVKETFEQWGIEEPLDDALLVVSELATNALTHAGSSYRVQLSVTDQALRIEVDDDGTGTPGAAAAHRDRGARPRAAPGRRAGRVVGHGGRGRWRQADLGRAPAGRLGGRRVGRLDAYP